MGRTAQQSPVDRLRAFQRGSTVNKKCADCTERGPTYVCLDFQTFVCQTCSGIHREFGHKVKGISLSEWTQWEVQGVVERGGNEIAAQEWLGKWQKDKFPEPTGADLDLVREFLKLKYMEKKWHMPRPMPKARPEGDGSTDVAAQPLAQDNVLRAPPASNFPGVHSIVAPPAPCVVAKAVEPATPAANWMADFDSVDDEVASATICPSYAHEGLIDFSFDVEIVSCDKSQVTGSASSVIVDAKSAATCDALCDAIDAKSATTFDVFCDAKSAPAFDAFCDSAVELGGTGAVAEPAEEPAPTSESAAAPPAVEASSIGASLRQAVQSGSSDEVLRIFRECSQKEDAQCQWQRRAVSPDHYAAFDDLCCVAEKGTPAQEWTIADHQQIVPTSYGSDASPMSRDAQAHPRVNAPSAEHELLGLDLGGYPIPGGATPSRAAPSLTPQQLAELMPQGNGSVMTPVQLQSMQPMELVQMQMMISQVLQARNAPQLGQSPQQQPPQEVWAQQSLAEAPMAPTPEFGDLLGAFHERNPVPGLQFRA